MAEPPEGRHHDLNLADGITVTDAISLRVDRGLNDIRLAVLGILIGVALGAASLADCWWTRLAAGLGTFVFACVVIGRSWTRDKLMRFMHWLIQQ